MNAKKLEERVTDILNEYIIRGSERMLDLTDPERREISNLVRSSPDVTNFDTAREKVVRNFLGTLFKTKQHTTRKTTQTRKKKHRRYANYYTKFIALERKHYLCLVCSWNMYERQRV